MAIIVEKKNEKLVNNNNNLKREYDRISTNKGLAGVIRLKQTGQGKYSNTTK